MAKYSITTEQIEALNSEYTTKEVIKLITDDVMTKKVEPHYMDIDKSVIENAVQMLGIIRHTNNRGACLLYANNGGFGSRYCSRIDGCPFGQNVEGGCDLSRAERLAREAINALEEIE